MAITNLSTDDLQRAAPELRSFVELQPSVAVVDDDPHTRSCLEDLIGGKGWQPLMFASGEEFLHHSSGGYAPNCLILELNFPKMSGLALQQLISPRLADMPIIFLAGQGTVSESVRALKAGAVEFFTKPTSDEVMTSAVERAIDMNRTSLARRIQTRNLEICYASLSLRERQVMDLVVSGHLNKVVGFKLGISEITVKAHRGQAMRKMRARSFADLVNMASKLRASIISSN